MNRTSFHTRTLEQLESRRHLSTTLVGDQLIVATGNANDSIYVSTNNLGPTRIIVQENGSTFSFSPAGINRVQVFTNGGNDSITIGGGFFTSFAPKTLIAAGAGNDTILGGNGADEIDAGAGNDSIYGGRGNDTILAGSGDDTLNGEAGDDYMRGFDGSDILDGGMGNDSMYGENNADTIRCGYVADGADVLSGGSQAPGQGDMLDYSKRTNALAIRADGTSSSSGEYGEGDRVLGDFEYLVAGTGNDTIVGASSGIAFEQINGNDGNDWINGAGGDDGIYGGRGNDTMYAGSGDDRIDDTQGSNQMFGEAGRDTMFGGTSADLMSGGPGIDYTTYNDRAESVYIYLDGSKTSGAFGEGDRLFGIEQVGGGRGNDCIIGDDYANTIYGGGGADYIAAGKGDDIVGINNDFSGNCTVYGNDGNDLISGSPGRDTIDGGRGNDDVRGYAGDDTILGGDGNDTLEGGDGNDSLDGGRGNDTLRGELGNDILLGNDGLRDLLDGGAGTDRFRADNIDQLIGLEIRL